MFLESIHPIFFQKLIFSYPSANQVTIKTVLVAEITTEETQFVNTVTRVGQLRFSLLL